MGKNKGKQFNIEKRAMLSRMVAKGNKAKEIGDALGMDPTSVSRELKRNRTKTKEAEDDGTLCRSCLHKRGCTIKKVCGSLSCSQRCNGCKAIAKCRKYAEFACNRLSRFPFVCNGCPKEGYCPLEHYAYLPDAAEEMARDRLTTSREGANLTYEEYEIQDAILRDRIIDKGQSIHHVLATNGKELDCSEKTLYRRIEKGVYTVKAHHLPRQVSLKKRKYKKKYEYEHDPKTDRTGHLYSDWLIYRYKNGITYYFQMDFLGAPRKSDKEILVLTMTGISFSLLYIIENATQEKITALFDTIEGEIGIGNFRKLFPAILTDRDTLFDDFPSLEFDKNGESRTRIFFCDPGESNQKPNVENYNAQLRPIFPKRAVLNEYSQQELYLASSNLNSRCLSSIDDRTPTDSFVEIFGKELLGLLHQRKIPPKEVRIKPIHR
ncbi:MAG: helix-turn-helix domain-containing protein [Erysipelotrichaceae bacterium]|nr:helix-turn-helix domain-containing protein [Erysipelotrichaceae bacterium]